MSTDARAADPSAPASADDRPAPARAATAVSSARPQERRAKGTMLELVDERADEEIDVERVYAALVTILVRRHRRTTEPVAS